MQDAIFKVKAELGSDAVILNTRIIREGGFFGFFSQKQAEVMAALPDQEHQLPISGDNSSGGDELQEVKEMLSSLLEHLPRDGEDSKARAEEDELSALNPLVQALQEKGLSDDLTLDLMSELKGEWRQITDPKEKARRLSQALKGILNRVKVSGSQGRVQAFVGPTGVGKTTTIAKLAANYVLQQDKQVALLTTDTYRIAAVEQLKTYSQIIDVPMVVIYKPHELREALESFPERDHILIDTAGLSPRNQLGMSQLESLIDSSLIDNTYLVLSAGSRREDMREAISRFEPLGFEEYIFTKLDETEAWGSIFNTVCETGRWCAYITNGQDVPEDIEQLKEDTLVQRIMEDVDYGSGHKVKSYS